MRLYFVTVQDDKDGFLKCAFTNVDRQAKLYRNLNGPKQVLARRGGGSIWSIELDDMSVTFEGVYGFKHNADNQVG